MKRLIILCAGLLAASASALEVGDQVAPFSAKDQDGGEWKLEERLRGKPIVVYFYPAAMTGGCTKQACSYRDYVMKGDPKFTVVAVSGDSVQNLKWFQTAEQLNFPLLSDPDGSIAKAFGVPVREGEKAITRTVDGKEVELKRAVTSARWTFIIGPDGKIAYKSDQVKPTADLENVLAFLLK